METWAPNDWSKRTIYSHKGYQIVQYPTHPRAWAGSKMVYVHRLVMENKLQRYLDPKEHIHHLDEHKTNNSIENLELVTPKTHNLRHPSATPVLPRACRYCSVQFKPNHNRAGFFCSVRCRSLKERERRPSKKELASIIQRGVSSFTLNWKELGRFYEVSDNCIKKWARDYGIPVPKHVVKPPRQFKYHRRTFTKKEVLAIRATYAAGGVTLKSLGEDYGVTKQTIWDLINKSWRHLG